AGQHAGDQLKVIKQTGALLVQAPVLTPDEQSMLDELVLLNRPGKSAGFQDLPGSSANSPESFEAMPAPAQPIETTHARPDIGPPPFPLNLLPEDQLKEFIRGRRNNQVAAPPSYFGSWHKQSTIANLPPSGFHSFGAPRVQFAAARYGPI